MEVWDLTLVRWRGEAMKPYQERPEYDIEPSVELTIGTKRRSSSTSPPTGFPCVVSHHTLLPLRLQRGGTI